MWMKKEQLRWGKTVQSPNTLEMGLRRVRREIWEDRENFAVRLCLGKSATSGRTKGDYSETCQYQVTAT